VNMNQINDCLTMVKSNEQEQHYPEN